MGGEGCGRKAVLSLGCVGESRAVSALPPPICSSSHCPNLLPTYPCSSQVTSAPHWGWIQRLLFSPSFWACLSPAPSPHAHLSPSFSAVSLSSDLSSVLPTLIAPWAGSLDPRLQLPSPGWWSIFGVQRSPWVPCLCPAHTPLTCLNVGPTGTQTSCACEWPRSSPTGLLFLLCASSPNVSVLHTPQDRKTHVNFDFFSFSPSEVLSDRLDPLVFYFCHRQPFPLPSPFLTCPGRHLCSLRMWLLGSLSLTPNYGLFDSREELENTFYFTCHPQTIFWNVGVRDSEVTSVLYGKRALSLFFVGNTCDDICIPSFIVTLTDGVSVDWIFQFPLPWFRSLQKDCSFWPGWTQEWSLTCLGQWNQGRGNGVTSGQKFY